MQADLDLFRALSEYSRELICLHEPSGRYIFVNEASQLLLGYLPEDLIGQNPYDYFHSDDLKRIEEDSHIPVLKGEIPRAIEFRFKRKDGVYVWLQTLTSPILDNDGNILQLLSTSRDVSERRQLQDALDRKARMLSQSNHFAKVGGYEYEIQSGRLHLTDEVFLIYGIPKIENAELKDLLNRFPLDLRLELKMAILQTVRTRIPFSFELPIVAPDSQKKFVKIWGQTEEIDGKVVRLLGAIQDITGYKATMSAYEFSEKKYTTAFYNSPVGIALISLEGKFIETNKALTEFLGYPKEVLFQKSIFDLTDTSFLEDNQNYFKQILQGKIDSFSQEQKYIHGNGEIVWGAHASSLIRDEYNRPLYLVSQIKNITERKHNEENLRISHEKLASALEFATNQNRQLEEFNQIVSHNLRSPIGNMTTIMELMEQATDQVDKEEYLKHLKTLIINANQTLEELIEVLKIRKSHDIEKQNLRFQDVLDKVKSMLIGQISRQNAEIVTDFSSAPNLNFPGVYLESILLNLLSNSLKYSKIEIMPFIQIQSFASGKDVILTFSDNGLGIDLNKYGQQIFKMHKVFHRHKGGKGIGLFLVKNQIESQGGTIQVRSVEGGGASFTLRFKDGLAH